MLVLSRHKEEEIVIGQGDLAAVIHVVEIRGDKVRLGISAPQSIPVHRREIFDAMVRDGKLEALPAPEMEPAP